jgi:hypothetical protein
MTDTTSQERYKLLSYEIEDLLKKLKERDDLWIDIGENQEGNNYPSQKIESNIRDKINEEVKKREEAWDIINDIYNEHKDMLDNIGIFGSCPTTNYKGTLGTIITKNLTSERRYGYGNYIISLNKENIQLLFIFIIALAICLIILSLRYFDVFNTSVTLIICISIITVYVFYLIKVIVLDRVNRNNIYFDKYDFNKPSEVEIKKGRKKENMDEDKGECKDDIYGRSANPSLMEDDTILADIKTEQGTLSETQCLSYKP